MSERLTLFKRFQEKIKKGEMLELLKLDEFVFLSFCYQNFVCKECFEVRYDDMLKSNDESCVFCNRFGWDCACHSDTFYHFDTCHCDHEDSQETDDK